MKRRISDINVEYADRTTTARRPRRRPLLGRLTGRGRRGTA